MINSREINEATSSEKKFTIGTLVRDRSLYDSMLKRFSEAGFTGAVADYIHINNTEKNCYDGYEGVRRLIHAAKGEFVILCHEDVMPIDTRSQLEACLAELDLHDPDWAVCGNAGGAFLGQLAIRISDPKGDDRQLGAPFPRKVFNLDENFIVLKRSALLAPSNNLSGFHFYGTDLCLQGYARGWSSYVIDYHVRRIGGESKKSKPDLASARSVAFKDSFQVTKQNLINKYSRLLPGHWYETPNARLFIYGNSLVRYLGNRKLSLSVARSVISFIKNRTQ